MTLIFCNIKLSSLAIILKPIYRSLLLFFRRPVQNRWCTDRNVIHQFFSFFFNCTRVLNIIMWKHMIRYKALHTQKVIHISWLQPKHSEAPGMNKSSFSFKGILKPIKLPKKAAYGYKIWGTIQFNSRSVYWVYTKCWALCQVSFPYKRGLFAFRGWYDTDGFRRGGER